MGLDFCKIKSKINKKVLEIYPEFQIGRSKDLMVRGKSFYAIWDEQNNIWSTDEYILSQIIDQEMEKHKNIPFEGDIVIKSISNFKSNSWMEFKKYISSMADNVHELDSTLTFKNSESRRENYSSKSLPYSLESGSIKHYDELIGTLYEPEERSKLEWAIGSIVAGDSKIIQKFVVLYGEGGSGKSTMLNIIETLFDGYTIPFSAKELTSNNNTFASEMFKSNPLVAIEHDGDLSKIEDNSKLNSIVSHETIVINEKFKPKYKTVSKAFIFMGTNKPVKITDGKSGIIRRLIDVKPSGNRIPSKKYQDMMYQIGFELGAIAYHCMTVYKDMGIHYYDRYTPINMMLNTDIFYNFIESHFYDLKRDDSITLKRAYDLYKEYCDESEVQFKLPKHKFREEISNYFKECVDKTTLDGMQVRNLYRGFKYEKFNKEFKPQSKETESILQLEETESLIDVEFTTCEAQYATKTGKPILRWSENKNRLMDLETTKLHYVKIPSNHIVIDFDLKDGEEKSLAKNMEAASKFPLTYAELSKSGKGIHLHYIYDGDPESLCRIYDEGIEVKVFTGDASLRRQLTKCNNAPIAKIDSKILKERGKKMLNVENVKSEKGIRSLIIKNLNKDIHPGTKPSMDFIHKILEDAYNSGLKYDVSDMRPAILTFAMNSSNQADYCIKLMSFMKFKSEESSENVDVDDGELVFFDVEVFPNLFVLCWKAQGKPVVQMINPTGADVEELFKFKLIGFNNRNYDNHILYARYVGYDNEKLYNLSQRIINNSPNSKFGEAYNLSYTDVYDFASAVNKKSLKKWEIELGIHHKELGLPWDMPVDESKWLEVASYCSNDVIATEKVFEHLRGDWTARMILADLSGLTVNDTTNQHSTKIIFGDNKKPQSEFIYTDLSTIFPGYKYELGKSTYKGETVGEGGWVYAEPGMYYNVGVMDIASMHPSTITNLNLFGDRYTARFNELKDGRLAIKNKDLGILKDLLEGKLRKYLDDISIFKDLSNALKTVINSIYGLTSAKFDNPFRDKRNVDNIVAKRGALFMIDLKYYIKSLGWKPIHIKTDSVKIPDITPDKIEAVMEFGKRYGYNFEHETTYDKMCLVNDAVYIAHDEEGWHAVGAQFAHKFVFKSLFTKEPIEFEDVCETKSVTTSMYLDFDEGLPEDEHKYHFVGRVGSFCPVKNGYGGGVLLREKEGKYYSVTGTKGYRWLEAEMVNSLEMDKIIDFGYFNKLHDRAMGAIEQYGLAYEFINGTISSVLCGDSTIDDCIGCPDFPKGSEEKCKKGFDVIPF